MMTLEPFEKIDVTVKKVQYNKEWMSRSKD